MKKWTVGLVVLLVLALLYALSILDEATVAEGFVAAEPLTTGVEVALWFSSHVFLRSGARRDDAPRTSTRYLYPEELPSGQGDMLWIIESSRDPPRTPARFQLLHREEPVRLRNARTGQYLVWERDRKALDLKDYDRVRDQAELWQWSMRTAKSKDDGAGLQWGDRVVLRPLRDEGALVLQRGVPTVLPNPMTGSDEILLVDRWGRGREKEQGRFGRARSSAGSTAAADAFLAIDGREDTYCRLLPPTGGPDRGKTWWELDLPMERTWVDRLAVTLPEMTPTMAPSLTISLWMNGGKIAEQTWNTAQLPKAPQAPTPTRMLTWEGVRGHVQRVRIDAPGPLYLAQVKVYGTLAHESEVATGIVPPRTLSLLPQHALEIGGPSASRKKPLTVVREAVELPTLRHVLMTSFWLRMEVSGAPRTMLWEWERARDGLSGWRLFVAPMTGRLDWSLHDPQGKLLTKLDVQVQDFIGRDTHVALFLRAPVSKKGGWHVVPGVCVVHPKMRLVYRLDATSPSVDTLPWFPNTEALDAMQDLGALQEAHLRVGLEIWIDGKKAAETTEPPGRDLAEFVPDGPFRIASTAPVGFYAQVRAMRMTNAEPTEELWAAQLREGGQLVRDIARFPVRSAELPIAGGEWFFGAWVYPRRRRTGGPQTVVSLSPAWAWTRMEDDGATAQFQWLNTTFSLALDEWSWVVLSYAPMKPRIFVQGRLAETNVMIQTAAPTTGDLQSEADTAEVILGRCRYGNMAIEREEESWTVRSAHPEAAAFRVIQDAWDAAGCPGRWDLERDPPRTRRWLMLLQRNGKEALAQAIHELYARAQRYLRQESPRGQEEADREALEVCYYPIPLDTWDHHWQAAAQAVERRMQTAPKCLPMAPFRIPGCSAPTPAPAQNSTPSALTPT